MSVFDAQAAMWRWMAESRLFLRLIAPLIMFGVIILFVRADIKNRQCVQTCTAQGHANGFHVGGRNSGDRCVCVDHQGKNVNSAKPKFNQEQ